MDTFANREGAEIIYDLIKVIQGNKQYLSEIDGAIGDGDHGINMNKGFSMAEQELRKDPGDFEHSLKVLSKILITSIGGAMGPLYGIFFRSMAKVCDGKDVINARLFGEMLRAAETGIKTIGNAKVGDKTLLDTLVPAVEVFNAQIENGRSFKEALEAMREAAVKGRDSTKDMVARVGRASRMGERSRGVLDPGATSMCLILESMANSIIDLINQTNN